MVLHVITDLDDYYSKIMDKNYADKLIVCYFTATWCSPCKMISPDITKIGEEGDNVVVLKIDVDECEDVSNQCNIQCMPTFHFHLQNAIEPVETLSGADKNSLFNLIVQFCNQINALKQQQQQGSYIQPPDLPPQ